jgi:Zn-dependent protease with chaperone function
MSTAPLKSWPDAPIKAFVGMTNDQWDELVRRLDVKAIADPRAYRRSVAVWAAGGYAVLVVALLLAVAAVVGVALAIMAGGTALLIKLGLPALFLALVIARALAVKLPPPEGIELTPADAPGLFETIEKLREQLGAPELDHVLLDGDFNASIVQLPRLGPLGWQRNYLTVGLPLMQALSREEFTAVLAHELGHIGGQHGRFSAWIYRLYSSWERVMEELDSGQHVGAGLMRAFFHWYVPRFAAHSSALRRAHEYEADRAAAEAVGARHASFALARVEASGAAVEGYWSDLYLRVGDEPTAPRTPFSGLLEKLPTQPSEEGARVLSRALGQRTDTGDSHPALRDRLAALGCRVDQLQGKALAPPESTAAADLIEPGALKRLVAALDVVWHEQVEQAWAERHAEARRMHKQLDGLDAQAAEGPLALEQAVERAGLTEELKGREAAVARWREVLALDEDHALANATVGAHLLAHDDETGLVHLDRAAVSDPSFAPHAAQLAYAFESARGRDDEASRHRSTVNAHLDTLDAASEERRGLSKKDELEPHNLPAEALSHLSEKLAASKAVVKAYVARKRVEHLADEAPLYVIGVVRDSKWWRPESSNADLKLVQELVEEIDLPSDFVAVPLGSDNKWLRKRLEGISGTQVFAR